MRKNNPLIIAHRGASAHAPENTLAAFRKAITAGADGVELDVQLSSDGVPVVIHDLTLKRTASRTGRVADFTANELGEIDVGSWFNIRYPKRARAEFSSETIPTLEQALELFNGFNGLTYIELKCDDTNFKPLVSSVCGLIRHSPLLPQIIVKSFKLAALPEFRSCLPNVQTAALFDPTVLNFLRRRKHIIALAREFGADQISLHRSLITPKLASLAHTARLPVTIWTADNPKWGSRCRKFGIKALITNDPAKMLLESNTVSESF